jgi:hypothetical protein
MFLNLFGLIISLASLSWILTRFPDLATPIKTYDALAMVGLGFYAFASFVSPMVAVTAVVVIVIIEIGMRKNKVNKLV